MFNACAHETASVAQGAALYRLQCASCHGESPIQTEFTQEELRFKIQTSMPLDNPNTLTSKQVADIVAFLRTHH
jgi:mono/diheme cytochrome c family protein